MLNKSNTATLVSFTDFPRRGGIRSCNLPNLTESDRNWLNLTETDRIWPSIDRIY